MMVLLNLMDESKRSHTPHPNSHTAFELKKIQNLIRRNPHISLNELYNKLRIQIGYSSSLTGLYRVLKHMGFNKVAIDKMKPYKPKPYHTTQKIGEKWQMNVKYVPKSCYKDSQVKHERFYQYTVIDEATRERFIYHYQENSSYSSFDFLKMTIAYFGYIPKYIQIYNERFYKYLKFYSYEDLKQQMKRYLYRSNRICTSVLNWRTPIEMRVLLINKGLINYTLS